HKCGTWGRCTRPCRMVVATRSACTACDADATGERLFAAPSALKHWPTCAESQIGHSDHQGTTSKIVAISSVWPNTNTLETAQLDRGARTRRRLPPPGYQCSRRAF